jgi:Fe-S-cluster containining protein
MDEVKRSVDCTARDFMAAWGRGDAGPVPCSGCTACCHYPAIVIDEKLDARRLAHLRTERSPDGELVLQRGSDGACIHLGVQGCTVYEQRPAVCRTFDCRIFAAMGLVEHCGPNHKTSHWEFARHR